MPAILDPPTAEADSGVRARAGDETRELALLAQFMQHDSVASLANAIAERLGGGLRGADLIASAGLDARRAGS
jgi:hypothetical protein